MPGTDPDVTCQRFGGHGEGFTIERKVVETCTFRELAYFCLVHHAATKTKGKGITTLSARTLRGILRVSSYQHFKKAL